MIRLSPPRLIRHHDFGFATDIATVIMSPIVPASAKLTARSLLLLAIAFAIGVAGAVWFTHRPTTSPKPTVTIQDGKTIDFSSGKPVIKDNPDERKIIADSVAEMAAAAKDVTFAPTPPAVAEKNPAKPPAKEPAKTP
ncbi:MAG TPA: hypothetical protein VG710_18815 [Opitutus sp.]|nr:hypothetical protein [Opitutus sp.]